MTLYSIGTDPLFSRSTPLVYSSPLFRACCQNIFTVGFVQRVFGQALRRHRSSDRFDANKPSSEPYGPRIISGVLYLSCLFAFTFEQFLNDGGKFRITTDIFGCDVTSVGSLFSTGPFNGWSSPENMFDFQEIYIKGIIQACFLRSSSRILFRTVKLVARRIQRSELIVTLF